MAAFCPSLYTCIAIWKQQQQPTFAVSVTSSIHQVTAAMAHGCQMAIAGFLESYVFGPLGFWTMAVLRYAAKFDPFLSLDCARVEGVGAQSKERKGSNFAA